MSKIALFAFYFLISLMGLRITSSAQESAKPLPPPPYLADLPGPAKWSITADSSPNDSSDTSTSPTFSMAVLSISVSKSPEGRLDVTKYAGGVTRYRWLVDGYEITRASGTDYISINLVSPNPSKNWINSMDFSELIWVNNTKPISRLPYKGHECLYFDADVPDPLLNSSTTGGNISTRKMKAWIDPETRLPVAFYDGIQTFTYVFEKPSGEAFSLPSDVATRLRQYIKRSKSLY